MKVGIIGTGYVGLATGVSLCLKGNEVRFYDKDINKIKSLRESKTPFFDPELQEALVLINSKRRAFFHENLEEFMSEVEVVFISISTTIKGDFTINPLEFEELVRKIVKLAKRKIIIVFKSTITPDLYLSLENLLENSNLLSAVNPEFLREGTALKDAMSPWRIVVGTSSTESKLVMEDLYKDFRCPKVFTDPVSAIIIKYASNSFLGVKISFINEIANLCEDIGGNIADISTGIGLDPRIGRDFLRAGIGFGGPCLPKDLRIFSSFAESNGISLETIKAALRVNDVQYLKVVDKLKKHLLTLTGKYVGVFGLSFKESTDDLRNSLTIPLISKIQEAGALVKAHDFLALDKAKELLANVTCSDDVFFVASESDAIVIATDWQQYRNLDWQKVLKVMKGNLVIDGRNLLNPTHMRKLGFIYEAIGKAA